MLLRMSVMSYFSSSIGTAKSDKEKIGKFFFIVYINTTLSLGRNCYTYKKDVGQYFYLLLRSWPTLHPNNE